MGQGPDRTSRLPPFLGVLAAPTVLLNAALSFLRDVGVPVRGPDALAVVIPMYNEEAGAARALASLLSQSEPLDEVVVSVNGCTDATIDEVQRTLRDRGFEPGASEPFEPFDASVRRWHHTADATRVIVVEHHGRTSKAESVNIAVLSKLVTSRRILVVDGDTVLAPRFAAAMRDSFYRLKVVRERSKPGGGLTRRYVVEDLALQSGSVRSQRPGRFGLAAWWIWLARTGEYAVSSVLRAGQTRRIGRDGPFARSRLFTVVGCGFVARRDEFPMPSDTRTEDHDFTLQVQNQQERSGSASARSLDERGFRLVVNGDLVPFSARLHPDTEIGVVKSGDARYVDEAVMYTDDPRVTGGLVKQLERWNGGALENAFKRLVGVENRRRLGPNVRFALVSALVENLLGLSLLLVVPALLGLRGGPTWSERLVGGMAVWLVLDFVGCLLLVLIGLLRAPARDAPGSRLSALPKALAVALPLQSLRLVNAVTYVAACTRVLPALVTERRTRASVGASAHAEVTANKGVRDPGVTWDRPGTVLPRAAYARTAGTALVLGLIATMIFSGSALYASSTSRFDTSAWRLTYTSDRVDQDDHALLPVGADHGLSAYCSPALRPAGTAGDRHVTGAGSAAYTPLSAFGLLMLGRLAPLLAHLEEAASAYDVDADLLLRVILNESYLDPLAVGQTEDLGLAQVTTDALTLLRSVSLDLDSALFNPALVNGEFSVFDPAFSVCAGAAKLAWAVSEQGGESDEVAYARYINPLIGVVRGRVADTHVAAVAAMTALTPLTDLLGSTIAAYRDDPSRVTREERDLLDVAAAVGAGDLTLRGAYARTGSLIRSMQILDVEFYDDVMRRLYGEGEEGTILATAPEM